MPNRNSSRVVRLRPSPALDLGAYLERRQRQVDRALDQLLPAPGHGNELVEAMRYAVFSGGKRIRPILALAASDAIGGAAAAIMPYACAIELIHAYSLAHDDLPAMDDDDMRRGQPSCHVRFGEALAILAGDALLTEAFAAMADAACRRGNHTRRAIQAIREIAHAAGVRGMVAGQVADMAAENRAIDLPGVEMIHIRKTGALIRAAIRTGAIIGGANAQGLRKLTAYADCVGLAFQIADDVLDAEGSIRATGKRTGRDRERHKATFPAVLGLGASKDRARELLARALRQLHGFDQRAQPLRAIAAFIVNRACADGGEA
jgi:geranylgeranyl diphosphate synthase type II